MLEIKYDDNNITLIAGRLKQSSTVIVTFGDMLSLADGNKAWADAPVLKNGYDIVSFLSKRRDWFPESRMSNALKVAGALTEGYDEVITYGGSMGAYAALKYACRVGAQKTIAFVPQYSINPADIEDRRYAKYYDSSIHLNMKITLSEISDNILIISDPSYMPDKMHVEKLEQITDRIRHLSLWGIEHNATALLAGSNFFLDLIHYMDGKLTSTELKRAARLTMRRRPMYYRLIARRLMKLRPQTGIKLQELANTKIPSSRTPFENAILLEQSVMASRSY